MRILAALSGGVDSSVAAARLVREGAEVIGVHLCTGVSTSDHEQDARRVAERLGIPLRQVDAAEAFDDVIRGFVDGYAGGTTPNPCVDCNARVKFGRLAEIGRAFGCAGVATGHYARCVRAPGGRCRLLRGTDRRKDQSYVLHRLDQHQLALARFPLGSSTKDDVRKEAQALGLEVAGKADSQDLCFVPHGDYRRFLRELAPHALVPGEIVERDGTVVGRHDGAAAYTVGQRKGLPALGRPRYVARVDAASGRVEVASREDVSHSEIRARGVNWIDEPEPEPGARFAIEAQHRYTATPVPADLRADAGGEITAVFPSPVFAPAPGQALVAYRGDAVLCGGTILSPDGP